jgi:hypothetical protein
LKDEDHSPGNLKDIKPPTETNPSGTRVTRHRQHDKAKRNRTYTNNFVMNGLTAREQRAHSTKKHRDDMINRLTKRNER